MSSFVIACLSCMYLLIFAPLVLRSISQLQRQRVVFFTFREGNLQARQLIEGDAVGYASAQLAGRTLLLGSVAIGLLQANLNLLILGTLAGLAIGAIANAYYDPRAQPIKLGEGGPGGAFTVRRFVVTRDADGQVRRFEYDVDDDDEAIRAESRRLAHDLAEESPDDMIEDAEYRPMEPSRRESHRETGDPDADDSEPDQRDQSP